MVAIVSGYVRFDMGASIEGMNQDCYEHVEPVISAPAAGPIPRVALHQLERATGCVGIFLEDRPYPNLLAVSIDLASLESIGTVHGSGPGTDLKDDHAYRVPGVSPERALIVVLAGNSDGPAIAWRAPFPVEACSLLAKPLRDGTPSVCR
ncbi:MAG: hypothetical protein E6J39_00010 [Chloroflexi bacterium]|nr:MAG: hypothetical protein E6J39_00010 [Chloroflexota bacterium]